MVYVCISDLSGRDDVDSKGRFPSSHSDDSQPLMFLLSSGSFAISCQSIAGVDWSLEVPLGAPTQSILRLHPVTGDV